MLFRERAHAHTRRHVSFNLKMISRLRRLLSSGLRSPLIPASVRRLAAVSSRGRPRLLFAFHGGNKPRPGVGQQLYRSEPAFRDAIRRCSAAAERAHGFSLSDLFERGDVGTAGGLVEAERRGIVLHSALGLALCDLWRAHGVEPDGVVGVSGGEISAAYAAGALTLEESAEVLCSVASVVTQRPRKGYYVWFDMDYDEARRLGAESRAPLEVTIDTGPSSSIGYCTSEDFAEVERFLSGRCAIRRATETEWAHHTPWAEAAAVTAEKLYRPRPLPLERNFYSPAAGGLIPAGTTLDPDHWYRAAVTPILFGRALSAALADGHDVVLNVCTNPGLKVVEECAEAAGRRVSVIGTMNAREPELTTLNNSRRSLRALGLAGARAGQSARGEARAAHVPAAADINLLRPDVLRDPYPHYAALARSGSAHFLTRHGFWLVLGYDDVAQALKNPRVFSSVRPVEAFDPVLIDADPPEHTRARRSLAPHFSAHPASALEGFTRECAERLLAAGDKDGGFDVVNDYAVPLSELVTGRFLGLPHEETAALGRELRARKNQLSDLSPLLTEWSRKYLEGLRESPREDACSRLLRGEGDRALAPEEVASLLKLLWAAGTLTPAISVALSVLLLLRHPDARRELQSDMSLLPAFVEESLRLESPGPVISRVAREEVTVSGALIPAGATVNLCIGAANRDPAHFAEPDRLSLRRSPNKHLSMGAGPHHCIGAALGRMEVRVALEVLLTRWPKFREARPLYTLSYDESVRTRALKSLYVRRA